MSDNVIKVAIPAETNQLYCAKCRHVYPGRFKAYSYFNILNDKDWRQEYIEYDSAGRRKSVECECPKCGSKAIPIFTYKCKDVVDTLSIASFDIVNIFDMASLYLTGDITTSINKLLTIQLKIPQLSSVEDSVVINSGFDKSFTIERLYDDIWELSSNGSPCATGAFILLKIKESINKIRAKDWYGRACRDRMYFIKSRLDSIRNKDDDKQYRVILSPPALYDICKDNELFACITVEDHRLISFIGEDATFPDGVEVALKSDGSIAIELDRDFDIDATDKWLNTILERMDKYESNN